MKVAVATDNGSVSGHFGYCEGFTVYNINNGEIAGKEYIASPGHQPGLLPRMLNEAGAEIVIAGGMGENAQKLFAQNNIKVMAGIEGECDAVIKELCAGTLKSTPAVCQEHMHSHGCGEHKH